MPTDHNPYCQHPTVIVNGSECYECRACGRVLGPAPDAPGLTADELAAMAARHQPSEGVEPTTQVCDYCSMADDHFWHDEPWPCDAARLLAEIARLRVVDEDGQMVPAKHHNPSAGAENR